MKCCLSSFFFVGACSFVVCFCCRLWLEEGLGCDGCEFVGVVGFAAQLAVAHGLVAHEEAAGGFAVVWGVGSASPQHPG